MIRCVALTPAVDVTYRLTVGSALTVGGINRPSAVHRRAGGKGTNVTRAVRGLGGETTLAAILGGTTGQWFRELAADEGLTVDVVDGGRSETRLCVTVLDRPGAPTDLYEPSAPVAATAWEALMAREDEAGADWTVVSGSAPPGVGAESLADLVGRAAARRPVVLDAHGSAVATALGVGLPLAVLKVNRAEAAGLVDLTAQADPADLCRAVSRRAGAALVVVTDSVRGAVAREANGGEWQVGAGPFGAFPTGSGDAFLAGLVLALHQGRDVRDALRRGAAAAAANARGVTAGDVSPERVAEAYAALGSSVGSVG